MHNYLIADLLTQQPAYGVCDSSFGWIGSWNPFILSFWIVAKVTLRNRNRITVVRNVPVVIITHVGDYNTPSIRVCWMQMFFFFVASNLIMIWNFKKGIRFFSRHTRCALSPTTRSSHIGWAFKWDSPFKRQVILESFWDMLLYRKCF